MADSQFGHSVGPPAIVRCFSLYQPQPLQAVEGAIQGAHAKWKAERCALLKDRVSVLRSVRQACEDDQGWVREAPELWFSLPLLSRHITSTTIIVLVIDWSWFAGTLSGAHATIVMG